MSDDRQRRINTSVLAREMGAIDPSLRDSTSHSLGYKDMTLQQKNERFFQREDAIRRLEASGEQDLMDVAAQLRQRDIMFLSAEGGPQRPDTMARHGAHNAGRGVGWQSREDHYKDKNDAGKKSMMDWLKGLVE